MNTSLGGTHSGSFFYQFFLLPNPSIMIHSRNFTSTVLRQKLFAAILFLYFGMLAGFSPLLHNHDVDLSDAHQDCASCQWSQSSTSLETDASGLPLYPFSEVLASHPLSTIPSTCSLPHCQPRSSSLLLTSFFLTSVQALTFCPCASRSSTDDSVAAPLRARRLKGRAFSCRPTL